MRPAILVLLFAIGSAVPAGAGQPPARPAAPAAPDAARTGSTTEDPAYYFILGRYLEGEGKLDEAIAAHKQAIALAPASAELRAELAGLYARNDRAKEALETAQAALEKDPDNQEANKILGTIYAALSDQRQPIQPGDNPADYPKRAIIALEKARREGALRHQHRPDARPPLRADRRVRKGPPSPPARRRRPARISGRRAPARGH